MDFTYKKLETHCDFYDSILITQGTMSYDDPDRKGGFRACMFVFGKFRLQNIPNTKTCAWHCYSYTTDVRFIDKVDSIFYS